MIQLAVSDSELYFTRCCALKRTGKFATESKVNVFILTDFKQSCFDVSFLTSISVSKVIVQVARPGLKFRLSFFFHVQSKIAVWSLKRTRHLCVRTTHGIYRSCRREKAHTNEHTVCGRPALKGVKRFRNGSVCKPYERSIYRRTFCVNLSRITLDQRSYQPRLLTLQFDKKKAASEASSYRIFRRDREPSRIQTRTQERLSTDVN